MRGRRDASGAFAMRASVGGFFKRLSFRLRAAEAALLEESMRGCVWPGTAAGRWEGKPAVFAGLRAYRAFSISSASR